MSAENQSTDRARRLAEGWADYRRRQWFAALISIGFIPLTGLIVLSIEALTRADRFITPFVAALALLVLGAWCRFILFRCPHCGRNFHLTPLWHLTRGRRCPHCGLERYQVD
jgi:hypothetical protein